MLKLWRPWLLSVLLATPAQAFELHPPIDCSSLSAPCFIQNYPDTAPGKTHRDYRCRHLSYDGHKGTDFRLPDMSFIEKGIPVIAAADGTVTAMRDGEEDGVDLKQHAAELNVKGCGNAVRITHADGWVTLYCHMKKGSVAVKNGQPVKTGDKLGEVGQSGLAEFPHVHLEVLHDGTPFDPFTGAPVEQAAIETCSGDFSKTSLWAAGSAPAYQPTARLNAGFAAAPEDVATYQKQGGSPAALSSDAPALLFWVNLAGTEQEDALSLTITGPDGSPLAAHGDAIPQKATYYHFIGKKKPPEGWKPGIYTGTATLTRRNAIIVNDKQTVMVK